VIERALQLKSCVLGACCILIERALQFKSYVVGVCYLYLFTHTGVQHDFHIRRCSCRLTVTRRVPLVEQELLTLSEHLSSPPVFSGVCVTQSFVLCVCFVDHCLSFCLFSLAIALSFFLRFTDSDYPFCIFKLLLQCCIYLRILSLHM
jgi:hypothetical protein